MRPFELVRGGVRRPAPRRREAATRSALPNAPRRAAPAHATALAPPSDDVEARHRELLVVLALCRAQAAGARQRLLGDRALTLVRDG